MSNFNVETLKDGELLQLLLDIGTENLPKDIVTDILSLKGRAHLKDLNPQQLTLIDGFTNKEAEKILAAIEFGRRVYSKEEIVGKVIRSPKDAFDTFEYLKFHSEKHYVVAFLNEKSQITALKTLSSIKEGTVREIFQQAVRCSAEQIIVAVNHLYGDLAPYRIDRELAEQLVEAGRIMEIYLRDFLIIGPESNLSLKQKGYIL